MVNVKNKRVFLSGPMSDDPETYHACDFIEAHVKLKKLGARVVYDPLFEWLREEGKTGSHEHYMLICIRELVSERFCFEPDSSEPAYDLLVQLPGWDASEGARTEYEVAKACGIPVCGIDDVC